MVSPGHPFHDPVYDRGGEGLIDANTDETALEIHQAPNPIGSDIDEENEDWPQRPRPVRSCRRTARDLACGNLIPGR